MGEGRRGPLLWGLGIGAAIIALVIIALVRDPVQLDPNTPEGVVQGYLQAINDDDYAAAIEFLEPEEFEDCDPGHISRQAPFEPFTASLGESDGNLTDPEPGDTAWVAVTMRHGPEGPFGATWENREQFSLVWQQGSWWITGEPWPYFSWDCKDGGF